MLAPTPVLREEQTVEDERSNDLGIPVWRCAEVEAPEVKFGDIWQVVGGEAQGGIVVREGPDTESAKVPQRLSRFALVRVLDFVDGRFQYELLKGTGPTFGWVLRNLMGKDMLVPAGPSIIGGWDSYSNTRIEDLLGDVYKNRKAPQTSDDQNKATVDKEDAGQIVQQDCTSQTPVKSNAKQSASVEIDQNSDKGLMCTFGYAVSLNSNQKKGNYSAFGWFDIRNEACERAALQPQIWEVVGGDEKAGIIVKKGLEIGSEKEAERLSTGARVVQVELVGDRLHYQRLSGKGPRTGWLTTQLAHKKLVIPVEAKTCDVSNFRHGRVLSDRSGRDYAVVGVRAWNGLPRLWFQPLDLEKPRSCCFEGNPMALLHPKLSPEAAAVAAKKKIWDVTGSEDNNDGILVHTSQHMSSEVEEVKLSVGARLEQVALRGERLQYRLLTGKGPVTGWVSIKASDGDLVTPVPASAIENKMMEPISLQELTLADFDVAEDAEGEKMSLCRHCRLPLGKYQYSSEDDHNEILHAECRALDLVNKEAAQQQKEAELKKAHRLEYGIGWKAEHIPRNINLAAKLECQNIPEGMCCLVFDESTGSAHISATAEPAAAINLAYLSTALRVRHEDGREPFFSLDSTGNDGSMQAKRFEPEWLMGTSLGEVMFQADYYMKELALGDIVQPVVGMKSSFDFLEEGSDMKEWYARLWYYVQRAEIYVSEDNVLLPSVKMGVETREQKITQNGLEDARVTRPGHPLANFAQMFMDNFNLIAERKSAVFNLREAAKSVLLAKFLLESRIRLGNTNSPESWIDLVDRGIPKSGCWKIPQLWNEHRHTKIQVHHGKLKVGGWDKHGKATRLYGGVEFGLDQARAQVPQFRAPVAGPQPPKILLTPKAGPTGVETGILRQIREEGAAAGPIARFDFGLGRTRAIMTIKTDPDQMQKNLKGVDLSMDNFDVSHIIEMPGRFACDAESAARHVPIGNQFWSWISEDKSKFAYEDASLFRDVFKPELCDRRMEGQDFIPPESSRAYLVQLRDLVEKEGSVRHERYWRFMSKEFNENNPGPVFPSSWRPLGDCPARERGPMESIGIDTAKRNTELMKALKCASPVFDKVTEDGIHFRIYSLTNIEVRTCQWPTAEEFIGAIYVIGHSSLLMLGAAQSPDPLGLLLLKGNAPDEQPLEQVVKITEYVEHTPAALGHHFIIFETKRGSMILTEQLADGTTTWEIAPIVLENRNTSPRTLRSDNVNGVFVLDLLAIRDNNNRPSTSPSSCQRKRYAQSIYNKTR